MLNSGGGDSFHVGDVYIHLPHPRGTGSYILSIQLHTGPDHPERACLFYPEADFAMGTVAGEMYSFCGGVL